MPWDTSAPGLQFGAKPTATKTAANTGTSVFGVPLPVLTSTFFGAMKGGAANAKIEQMNAMAATKQAATLQQGMKTQETINRNLSAAEDAYSQNQLVIQMNQREAEGAASAEAAATGANPEQAIREINRNAAMAQDQADAELRYAADAAELASYSVASQMNSVKNMGKIEYNPYLNVALSAAGSAIPSMYQSGLIK